MSDSNLSTLRYVAESTFNETPATPAFKTLLIRSSSLKYEPQTVTDDQIRGDRGIMDATLVGYDVSGDAQCRLTYGALDDILASALYSTWNNRAELAPTAVTSSQYTVASGGAGFPAGSLVMASGFATAGNNGLKVVTSSTGTAVSVSGLTAEASPPADARIKLVGFQVSAGNVAATAGSTNSLDFTTFDPTLFPLVAGMWVKIGGTATGNKFGTAANNGFARVQSVSSAAIVLSAVPEGWTTDNGSGKTIRIFLPDYVRDGATRTSFSIERQYRNTAGTDHYEYFRGCIPGQMRAVLQPRQNIEVNFDIMGVSASDLTTSRTSGATTVAPVASDVMNTSSNVAQMRAGGVVLRGVAAATETTITVNNNLRTREGVGSMSVIDVRAGRFDAKVEFSAYFENTTLINKIRQDQETSFDIAFRNPTSDKAYVLDFPRGKFTAGQVDPGRIDTDIMTPMEMQALQDETLGYTMSLSRFSYLEF